MKEFLIWERDLDEKLTCRTIPYDTMVLAYPEAYDEKTGEMTAPEIQEITGSMKGNLIIRRSIISASLTQRASICSS